jgi:hypothetical protein
MTDETTLKFIQQDIEQCEDEIAQIRAQIEFLTSKRQALDFKLKALKDAAATLDTGGKTIEVTIGDTVAASDSMSATVTRAPLLDVGLREAIRRILRDSASGLRPRDIVAELARRGFRYEATTDLSTRISNELFRMKRSGQVRKRGKLYYSPQEMS